MMVSESTLRIAASRIAGVASELDHVGGAMLSTVDDATRARWSNAFMPGISAAVLDGHPQLADRLTRLAARIYDGAGQGHAASSDAYSGASSLLAHAILKM